MNAGTGAESLPAAEMVRQIRDALQGGEPVVGVVLIAAEPAEGAAGEPLALGRRMLVWTARSAGTLGAPELDAATAAHAREALRSGSGAGTREIEVGDVRYTVYLEPHHPPPELVIVGAGHIARPLCQVGAMLGFRVTVLDDRPAFATRERFPEAERVLRADFSDPFRGVPLGPGTHLVLVTRGHKYDYDALRDALRRPIELPYIGMVGSRRRTRAALAQLAQDGIPRERLLGIHAPIGLDIGAETPEEIAVAIAAEIIRLRRGGTGESLRDRSRVAERWIPEPAPETGTPE